MPQPDPNNALYSSEALDVVLHEAERARQLQSTRLSNMHSRAGVLVGASGLAAGLVTSTEGTPFWMVPLGLFFVSALFGLLVLLPSVQRLSKPRLLLNAANGKKSRQLKYEVADAIAIEFEELEELIKRSSCWARCGFISFALAVLSLVTIASIYSVTTASEPEPIHTIYIIPKGD